MKRGCGEMILLVFILALAIYGVLEVIAPLLK